MTPGLGKRAKKATVTSGTVRTDGAAAQKQNQVAEPPGSLRLKPS